MLKVANALQKVGAWLFGVGVIGAMGMSLFAGENYGTPFGAGFSLQ
jgi:hypothetical protein